MRFKPGNIIHNDIHGIYEIISISGGDNPRKLSLPFYELRELSSGDPGSLDVDIADRFWDIREDLMVDRVLNKYQNG